MKDLITEITETNISIIANPFNVQSIERIFMVMDKNIFSGNVLFYVNVQFKNGDTKGEQRITGDSFEDLFKKLQDFVKTINP